MGYLYGIREGSRLLCDLQQGKLISARLHCPPIINACTKSHRMFAASRHRHLHSIAQHSAPRPVSRKVAGTSQHQALVSQLVFATQFCMSMWSLCAKGDEVIEGTPTTMHCSEVQGIDIFGCNKTAWALMGLRK